MNLSGSINRGTCPSAAEDLFQDLHITEKNYKAEINTSPIITHCRLGSLPRFPWLFVLIKCLHGTQGGKVISSCQSRRGRHQQEEAERRGDIHPLFSLILGIKVIPSKWLKGTGPSSSPWKKEKLPWLPTI